MASGFGTRLYHVHGSIAIPAGTFGAAATKIIPTAGVLRYGANRRTPLRIVGGYIESPDRAVRPNLKLYLFGRPLVTAEIPQAAAAALNLPATLRRVMAVDSFAPGAMKDMGGFLRAEASLRDQEAIFVPTFFQDVGPTKQFTDPELGVLVESATSTIFLAQTIDVTLFAETR